MAETFVRQAPYIEERSEQLLASVFGDPNAERRKDPNTGEFTEGLEDFNLRRFGRAGVSRQVPQYSVAGLNQDQIDAFQRTRQGLGGFAPFLQQAQGTLQSGVGAALAGTPYFAQGAQQLGQGAQMFGQGATGITGQDGAYLAEFLLNKGYEVHGIKRRTSLINTDRIDHLYEDPHKKDKKFFYVFDYLLETLTSLINEISQDYREIPFQKIEDNFELVLKQEWIAKTLVIGIKGVDGKNSDLWFHSLIIGSK